METWLGAREKEDQIFFCDENRRNALSPITKSESTFLLVGSEGGWSETERQQVQKRGVTSLSLGKNRLRVEMACIVGTVLLKTKLGEI
jgi:16S rRNA (uracil1498-N3)-methyltransferase